MGDLIIRDVDDDLVQALSDRAVANSATLTGTAEMLLRSALERAPEAGYSPDEIVAIVSRSFPRDSTHLIRRDRDGVSENELLPEDALRTILEIRSGSLRPMLSDSTPHIRMDRDA